MSAKVFGLKFLVGNFWSKIAVKNFGQKFRSKISVKIFSLKFRSKSSVHNFGQKFRSGITRSYQNVENMACLIWNFHYLILLKFMLLIL